MYRFCGGGGNRGYTGSLELVITLNIYRVGLAEGNEPKVHIIPDQGEQRIHLVLDETNAVRAQSAQVDLDVQLQREARLVPKSLIHLQ